MDQNPPNESDNLKAWLDPELEARVIASLLGESSDFEQSELDRLLKEHPELEVFSKRISRVHDLVGEAERDRTDDALRGDWKLSEDRRKSLLEAIGGKESPEDEACGTPSGSQRGRKFWWVSGLSVAAVIALAAVPLFSTVSSLSDRAKSEYMMGDSRAYREEEFLAQAQTESAPPAPSRGFAAAIEQESFDGVGMGIDATSPSADAPTNLASLSALTGTPGDSSQPEIAEDLIAVPIPASQRSSIVAGGTTSLITKIENVEKTQREVAVDSLAAFTQIPGDSPRPEIAAVTGGAELSFESLAKSEALGRTLSESEWKDSDAVDHWAYREKFGKTSAPKKTAAPVLENFAEAPSAGPVTAPQSGLVAGKKVDPTFGMVGGADGIVGEWGREKKNETVEYFFQPPAVTDEPESARAAGKDAKVAALSKDRATPYGAVIEELGQSLDDSQDEVALSFAAKAPASESKLGLVNDLDLAAPPVPALVSRGRGLARGGRGSGGQSFGEAGAVGDGGVAGAEDFWYSQPGAIRTFESEGEEIEKLYVQQGSAEGRSDGQKAAADSKDRVDYGIPAEKDALGNSSGRSNYKGFLAGEELNAHFDTGVGPGPDGTRITEQGSADGLARGARFQSKGGDLGDDTITSRLGARDSGFSEQTKSPPAVFGLSGVMTDPQFQSVLEKLSSSTSENISPPFPTSGKVNMQLPELPFPWQQQGREQQQATFGDTDDDFATDLSVVPDVVEFAGVVNDGAEKEIAEFVSPRSADLVDGQDRGGEFQRYSGHPATANLSTVELAGGDGEVAEQEEMKPPKLVEGVDGFAIDLSVTPEVVEFEGFVNDDVEQAGKVDEAKSRFEDPRRFLTDGEERALEPGLVTRSGQRAEVDVVREFIYPTEFDPPEIPNVINIEGNTKTSDEVIRRELAIAPGDEFNTEKIDASRRRLEDLGYFEQNGGVDINTSDSGSDGIKDLNTNVREKDTGAMNFGAGFSSIDNLVGFTDITQSNFDLWNSPSATGGEKKFRTSLKAGSRRKDFALSLADESESTDGGEPVARKPVDIRGIYLIDETEGEEKQLSQVEDSKTSNRRQSGELLAQETKVEDARARMLNLMDKYRIVDLSSASPAYRSKDVPDTGLNGIVRSSMAREFDPQANIESISTQIETLNDLEGEELIATAFALGIQDSTVSQMYPQYMQLKVDLTSLQNSGLDSKHPDVIRLREQVAQTQSLLKDGASNARKALETQLTIAEQSLRNMEGVAEEKEGITDEKESLSIDEDRKHLAYMEAKKDYEQQKTLLTKLRETSVARAMSRPGGPLAQRESIRRGGQLEKADKAVASADDFLAKGDVNGAVTRYREALDILPNAPKTQEQRNKIGQRLLETSATSLEKLFESGDLAATETLLEETDELLTTLPDLQELEQEKMRLGTIRAKLEAEAQKKVTPLPSDTPEVSAAAEPFSTFSLNVSDVSFKLAQAALAKGEWPDRSKIRPEEFVNAFDYGDPSPAPSQKVSCKTEQCAHPFAQQRNLLRIGVRTAAIGRNASQPLRLTVLLDNSGSMQREDREESVRSAMRVLASQLGANDSVSLIGFARQPRLLAESISGDKAQGLVDLVENTPSDGGTNLDEAMKLAQQIAARQFDPAAQNRVILMTDGAANLGDAKPELLSNHVDQLRQTGISFDACGVGAKGFNDEILEALTRKGDGRYYFLDTPDQADAGFARQLAGALRPAAKNVKVQVKFNPERVGAYRLIGFEKHILKKEDFRNDKVDAAEMAAEEAGNALYQIEAKPDGRGEIGEVFVRFQDAATGQMVERSWIIPHDSTVASFDAAAPSLQLAGTAAMLAERLGGTAAGETVELGRLTQIGANLRGNFSHNVRVKELVDMVGRARGME